MKDNTNITIGLNFRAIRRMNYLRQVDFAHILGSTQSRITGVENGTLDIPPKWIMRLVELFNVNPMFMLGLSKNVYLKDIPASEEGEVDYKPSPYIEDIQRIVAEFKKQEEARAIKRATLEKQVLEESK